MSERNIRLRERLNRDLERYAEKEEIFEQSTMTFACPRCGGHASRQQPIDPLHWRCLGCGQRGDTVDLAMLLHPDLDERGAIRHICSLLGRKILELDTISAGELMRLRLKPRPWLVEGMLTPGLILLAGPAKIGKSWMVLYIADRVSKGEPVWDMPSRQAEVLYLSLEDTLERLQSRLIEVTGGEVGPVYLGTEAQLIGEGFEEQLMSFLREHPKVKLVILDTLQKVRQLGRENYSYAGDYATMGRLKTLADSNGITILLVHHTRKQQAEDKMDLISGTNGIGGAADGMMVMAKHNRSGDEATLTVTGRDMGDQVLKLSFDRDRKQWTLLSRNRDPEREQRQQLCRDLLALTESGPWEGTVSELIAALGLEESMTAQKLGLRLRGLQESLRQQGLSLESKRTREKREIRLSRREDVTAPVTR